MSEDRVSTTSGPERNEVSVKTQNEKGEWVDAKPIGKVRHWGWLQRIVDWFYRNRVR